MIFFPIIASLISIAFAGFLIFLVKKYPTGSGKQIEIWEAIRTGSRAYLRRQNMTVTIVAIVLAAVIWLVFDATTAVGFLAGASASLLAGYLGMMAAVDTNVRTTEAAKVGLPKAFRVAFLGGSVTGFLVVGLGLFSVSVFYYFTQDASSLIGLAFGGSLVSVFARLGCGIYTKAADVGADLVGKVEAGIPEDDPRNPAVIADNVGDNVGDCAGMAADLFETYAVTAIAAMLLGSLLYPGNETAVLLPLFIGGVTILASIIGTFAVRVSDKTKIMGGLYRGLIASAGITAVFLWFAFATILADERELVNPYYTAAVMGLLVTALMVLATEYYTSKRFRPVQTIAKSSLSGHGTNIIMGLAFSLEATALPIIIISAGMLAAFIAAGLYGIALAAMTMLAMAGIIVGLFVGGMMPYFFGSIAMRAVGKTAQKVVDEVRRQFKEITGIMEGTAKPEYDRTVDIVTKAALREMILPALIPVAIPILLVVLLRGHAAEALGGLLMGSIITGLFVAISMTSGGAAWDNAKKYIEEGNYGGKKSPA